MSTTSKFNLIYVHVCLLSLLLINIDDDDDDFDDESKHQTIYTAILLFTLYLNRFVIHLKSQLKEIHFYSTIQIKNVNNFIIKLVFCELYIFFCRV